MIYNNYEKSLGAISHCKDDELFNAIREYDKESLYYQSNIPITFDDTAEFLFGVKLHSISVGNRNDLYRRGMFSLCRTSSFINTRGEISFWRYFDTRSK